MALKAEGDFERQQDRRCGPAAAFRVLKEGYLNVNSNVDTDQLDAWKTGKSGLGLRKSFSRSWKKRWCTLSQTRDNGTSLLYYKHQSSPGSIDAPVGVLLMDGGCKVYPVPAHPKSSGVFAIEVPQRTTLFYADREAETEQWLDVLKVTLLTPGEPRTSTTSLVGCATAADGGERPLKKKPLTVSLSSPG